VSELYRKLDCSRYDGYCHGCPAEHLPEGVECQINAMRDEQAERDRDLGARVRKWFAERPGIPSPVRICRMNVEYAYQHGFPQSASLWNAIADALEAEEAKK